jgi:hypothetical protein
MGWSDHPIFGQGVASATPYRPYGGGRSHPRPLGVVRPPRKAKKKKKTGKMGFGLWGWPDHPLGPRAGFGHHLPVVGGGRSHPQALGGGPATPKIPNPFFPFFFFLAFRGGRTTPKGLGWLRPPPYGRYGVAGYLDFFLFFFFFFFLISFFFSKKKKKKKTKT